MVASEPLPLLAPSAIYHGTIQPSRPALASLGRFEEPAVLILTSLVEGPRHGYAIVQDIESVSGVRLGPGTLYATLSRLEARDMIQALPSDADQLNVGARDEFAAHARSQVAIAVASR